jgi:hypothetical protein
MKRILMLTLAVCLFTATTSYAAIEAAWTASIDQKRPDRIYFSMTEGDGEWHSQSGMTMRLADVTGLTSAQVNAATMTPVRFELRREAGTAVFEGTYRNGKGAGQLSFTGNRGYIDALRALGVDFDLRHRRRSEPVDEERSLFTLALHDVSTAFIKSMQAEGYRVPLEKYLSMRIFDVTPEYIHEMRSLGFKNLDSEELVATRIHKVTPDYIRQMRAAGWDLTLEQLQSSRIFKATPEFAAEMRKLGYNLDFQDLVNFRIHQVTPEFINELRQLGYSNVSADDLVSMRIHKVTPEFIRELKAAGYTGIPVEKLVSMRIHGLDAAYLKKMNG